MEQACYQGSTSNRVFENVDGGVIDISDRIRFGLVCNSSRGVITSGSNSSAEGEAKKRYLYVARIITRGRRCDQSIWDAKHLSNWASASILRLVSPGILDIPIVGWLVGWLVISYTDTEPLGLLGTVGWFSTLRRHFSG